MLCDETTRCSELALTKIQLELIRKTISNTNSEQLLQLYLENINPVDIILKEQTRDTDGTFNK